MNETMIKPITRSITTQDWKDIEQKLMGFYDRVVLICDGYELYLQSYKNHIGFYVNGVFKGKWILEDCEERRRFFRKRTKDLYPKKELDRWKKVSMKIYKDRVADNKYTYYDPRWTSFRSLKSHLVKNNKNIEIVLDPNDERGKTYESLD